MLVTREEAILITDGRYIAQAEEESSLPVDIFERSWLEHLANKLGGRTLAFEAESVTYALFEDMQEKLGQTPKATRGLIAELRLVKTPDEIETLRQAAKVTDDAFTHILGFIKPGRSEVEVALELKRFMRSAGAEGASLRDHRRLGPPERHAARDGLSQNDSKRANSSRSISAPSSRATMPI